MAQQTIKVEKQQHREAFEVYYLLGEGKRSIRKVAKQLGRPPSTIQIWAQSFNWQERAEIRDAEVQRQFGELQKKTNDTLVDMKATYHKFLKALIAEALADMKAKKLKIESIGELIKVMELDLSLLGEEDRRAQGQMEQLNQAIQASLTMFGYTNPNMEYDGKDRIEGDSNGSDTSQD